MREDKTLYLVIPCYQEQEVLPETARRVKEKLLALTREGMISAQSRVLFVNDGSKDKTWNIIKALHEEDELFSGICLSRNRGHQNALLAGLTTACAYADMIVSMDADLQDDVDAIDKMVRAYHEGFDIVYGVRSERKTDSAFKRSTAQGFYRLMQRLGADIVYNHADFRLMSRRTVEALNRFNEVNLFLRGIIPQIGYPSTSVSYERKERFAGESKYPFKKMLAFALDGITSFSVKPMRLILHLGAFIFVLSIIGLLWSFIAKWTGRAVSGWSSLMASIWLIGGIQLLSLGVIGEYIGKIYSETKARPRYIIQEFINTAAPDKRGRDEEC